MSPILTSVLLGLTAAAANVFGGAIIVQRNWERSYLRYFVALGAGFMLADGAGRDGAGEHCAARPARRFPHSARIPAHPFL